MTINKAFQEYEQLYIQNKKNWDGYYADKNRGRIVAIPESVYDYSYLGNTLIEAIKDEYSFFSNFSRNNLFCSIRRKTC